MTAPKLTKAEEKLARRAGGGRVTATGTAWVKARRKSPGLTLREFELRKSDDLDPAEGTAPEKPVEAAPVPEPESSTSTSTARRGGKSSSGSTARK